MVDLPGLRRETREQALERLFNEHSSALRGFLRVRLGVREEMDDVVQDVFAKLADLDQLPERLPPGEGRNRSYLFAVANHLVVDMERSRDVQRRYLAKRQLEAQGDDGSCDATPEVITLAQQELDRVKQVITRLPPLWRQAFILNRFKHKSYREVANEMGISVKTVEKYIKKALVKVRRAALAKAGGSR